MSLRKPILYMNILSPPVRSTLLTAAALGVSLELKVIDFLKGEHLNAEYLKINPQHTIPTLDDNGTIVIDSNVINGYLVDKFGKDDVLYPKDMLQRGFVDRILHYNTGALFSRMRAILEGMLLNAESDRVAERVEYVERSFPTLEAYLKNAPYVCGKNMTIADFACISSMSTVDGFAKIEADTYPNILAWMERMKQLPYYEECNGKGADSLKSLMLRVLNRNLAAKNKAKL